MKRAEFESKIPYIIIHPSHGESEMQIKVDKEKDIIVGYKNRHGANSYGTIGKTWQEVFDKLYPFLIEEGHINKVQ
ncbi:MAG: hypothetical protein IPO02_10120 [Bacteroidetes bacterium]|jgi:hypothetical protein|nr:hypothetical protein [Bacteroidota bacterium]